MRVYNAAPKYRPQAKFSTWIFRIATNVCLNQIRGQKHGQKTESLDKPLQTASGQVPREIEDLNREQPPELLEFKEKEHLIRQNILALPGKQRAALILRVYHDFSYREIAQQLNTSEGEVKTLIHRGRQQLKQALQVYWQDG